MVMKARSVHLLNRKSIMKYKNIIWVCLLTICCQVGLQAQPSETVTIEAEVLGAYGKPLAEVTITTQAGDASVITNKDGRFRMEVPAESVLSITALGYITKLVIAETSLTSIELEEDLAPGAVQIAYREVDPDQLNSSVSYINMSQLLDKNYITNSLSDMDGLVPGFRGGLWGNDDRLVLVDGVPRDATSVLPVEVEQVTFLKGVAAVALYGSRGAKGVVLITTKRGKQLGNSISVRMNSGIHIPKRFPEYLSSAEYMAFYNEARRNDGLSPRYSEEDIYNHASGENPYRYPNVNFYDEEYLQKVFSRHDATLEISGGNDKTKYYTNMGFYTEGTLLDFGAGEDARNNRFNIRGNVDINLHRNITAKVDAAAIYYAGRGTNTNYWEGAANLRPHRVSPLVPIDFINSSDQESLDLVNNSENIIDGKYFLGGTQLDPTNPVADVYAGGTSVYNSRQFQFNTSVNANLSDAIEGLSFRTNFGIDYATIYSLSFENDYATFNPYWVDYNGESELTLINPSTGASGKYGQDASTGEQSISGSWFRQTLSMSSMLDYQRAFKEDHLVSAMLVAGGFQIGTSGDYHKVSNANMGLHLGYSFKNKYYAEFNGALVHSAKLPENHRKGFSPTATLGWRMSNEGFLSGSSVINNLKLNVSAGILHTDMDIVNPADDGDDYFLYENIYRQTDGAWYTWKDGLNNRSTDSRRGANPNMTMPKREEVSAGFEGAFLDNRLMVTGSVFFSKMTGRVVRNDILFPNYFTTANPNTSFIPFVNYDDDLRKGFDFGLSANQKVGEVALTLGVSGVYYTTEAVRRAEIYEDQYQYRQGRPLEAIWGLEYEGFFRDQADIDNSPEHAFGEVRPGDIKYKDQNNDGVINVQDEVYLGRWVPTLTMGVNLTAQWKNFTFFALGVLHQGGTSQRSNDYFWVNGEDKYSEVVRGRWTEQTMETATYPRLTTLNGDNNFRTSDFWLYSTNRFELRRVQVTYNFPERLLAAGWFKQLGVYVNGANLLMISPNSEIMELNIMSAPQTRFVNLGVTAQF